MPSANRPNTNWKKVEAQSKVRNAKSNPLPFGLSSQVKPKTHPKKEERRKDLDLGGGIKSGRSFLPSTSSSYYCYFSWQQKVMRFLIQECLSSSGGGESSHSHVDKVQDGALEESKSRDESSTFAYVSAAWHPSGDVYACGDAAVVSHWQPQVQAQPDHHGLNLGGGLGAGAGAGDGGCRGE